MTKITFTMLIACLLAISSCCTKKACSNYYEMRLSGFNQSELAGAYKLTAESDTIPLQIEASNDGSYYYIPDFTVTEDSPPILYSLPAAGKKYVLSDFIFDKRECNECAIGKDLYLQFSGCRVNGIEERGNIVTLEK